MHAALAPREHVLQWPASEQRQRQREEEEEFVADENLLVGSEDEGETKDKQVFHKPHRATPPAKADNATIKTSNLDEIDPNSPCPIHPKG